MNRLYKNKLFLTTIFSDTISTLGDAIFYIVLLTYSSKLSFAPTAIFLVTVSFMLPNLFTVFSGAIADRTSKRIEKIISLFYIRAGIFALIGILFFMKNESLVMFILILVLVTFATIVGNYSDSLYTPLFPKIVHENDIEQASGMNLAMMQIVNSSANMLGGSLLLFFSFSTLSWINSVSFILSSFLMIFIKKQVQVIEKNITNDSTSDKKIKEIISESYTFVKNNPVFAAIQLFLLINLITEPIVPLLVIGMKEKSSLVIISMGFSIALYTAIFTIGNFLGNIFGVLLFKKQSLEKMAVIMISLSIGLYLSAFFGNAVIVVLFQVFLGLIAGGIVPKFSAKIIQSVPENRLGTVSGALNAVLLFVGTGGSVIFTFIAQFIQVKFIFLVLGIFSFILCMDILRKRKYQVEKSF